MFLRHLLAALPVLIAGFAAAPVAAECAGRDLSATMSPQMRAAVDARLDGVPFAQGRHFAVEKAGATSWLFGTIHLPMDSVATPPDLLLDQLAGAEEVLLELTRPEERRMMGALMRNPGLVMSPDGRLLRDALSAAEWAQLVELAAPYGIPEAAVDRIAPWYLVTALANPPCLLRIGGGQILDRRIESLALAAGVTVTGLETFEDVFAIFADIPYETQVDMLRAGLDSFAESEDYLENTRQFYLRGEVQRIRAFSEVALAQDDSVPGSARAAARLFEALLVARNRNWMETLLPKLRGGNRIVAVGALHLGGKGGLLALLQAQGFAIRRLDG